MALRDGSPHRVYVAGALEPQSTRGFLARPVAHLHPRQSRAPHDHGETPDRLERKLHGLVPGLFRANRRPFYTVALVYSLNGFFTAWVLGSVPLGAVTPVQVGALLASALFVTGIVAQSERADAVIATIALLGVLVALATLPILASVQPGT